MSNEQVETIINIAEKFSDFPVGRSRKNNKFSGEEFRDDFLVPPLRENSKVIVDFENVFACPPSFLDEAFGGLIRKYRKDSEFLRVIDTQLDFKASDITKYDGYNKLAKEYMDRARKEIG